MSRTFRVVATAIAGAALTAATLLAPAQGRHTIGPDGGGELWVTAQDASRIHVLHGVGRVETIALPFGTSPHFVRVSPSGKYVYVPGLGYGNVTVLRAQDRTVAATVPIHPATPPAVNSNPLLPGGLGTHDAAPSPDGTVVLAAQWSNNTVVKIAADEEAEAWSVVDSEQLVVGGAAKRPICIAYHPGGAKAYVGTVPSGIVVIDVATLQILKTLPTTGAWSCSWAQTRDGKTMYATTNAAGGFYYRIDMGADTIEQRQLPAEVASMHIHGMGMSLNEKELYLTSREDDSLRIVDLESGTIESVSLDATPVIPDRPDSVAVAGNNIWITLRSSGKLARLKGQQRTVEYIELQPPCPADQNLCYALHAVELRR